MAQTGMDAFCGSEFWTNSGGSYLSPCFERTVLVWIPCAFLWLFLVFEIHYLVSSKTKNVPRTWLNVTKLVGTSALFLVAISDLSHAIYLSSNEYDTFAVDYTTPIIQAVTYLLGVTLVEANRRIGLRSSGLQFQFWLLAALCGALRFRSLINAALYQSTFAPTFPFFSYMVHYPVTVLMLLLNCWADAAPRHSDIPIPKNVCPERQSSFLSRLTFSWFDSMAWLGYRRPLEATDLWDQHPFEASEHLVPRFDKYWNQSLQKTAKAKMFETMTQGKTVLNKTKTSIVPAICKAFGPTFLFGSLLKFISDVTGFFNPIILQLLITFVWSDAEDWKGYLYAGLLFANVSFTTVILSQYFHRMFTVGLRIRSALISAIFRKALRLSSTARKETTVGEIVNLMSVDAQRFMDLIAYFNMIWSNPLQFSLCFYLLWIKLGVSVLAGLLVLLLLIPVDVVIAGRVRSLQVHQMARKDDRVRLISEILNGIKVLKLNAWEKSFEKQVLKIRNSEVKLLKKSAYYDSANSFIWSLAPILVSLVTFATFVLSSEENVLDAETAFVSLTLFNMMRYSLTMLPVMITSLVQASVSIKRINNFMNMDEVDPNNVSHDDIEVEPLVIENGTFTWGRDEAPVLKNISLRCKQGALVAVVGTVGSGKSSMLAALLGDMEKLSGRVNTKGSIAYVPQQAWIQNASLKDNILFSKVSDDENYERIIEACALRPDINILPGGDKTEIGEKGINLSGGQKQRVSLARAVHHDADVYLLDDPLSAVDSHVARHIFERVIGPRGLLRNKTRLLVTHGVTFLPEADLIVVLKDGEVTEVGTYTQLMAWHGAFADFMNHHHHEWHQEEGSEETDTEFSEIKEKTLNEKDSSIEAESKKPDKKLIETEKSEVGSVKWSVYAYYSLSVGVLLTASTLLFNVAYQGLGVASNVWLSVWSSAQTNASLAPVQRDNFLGVYAALGAGQALFVLLPSVTLVVATVRAAVRLHGQLLSHTLHKPMSFFETTPAGRVVNRFAKDVDVVDNTLPANLRTWLASFFSVIATLVVISLTNQYFIILIIPIGVLYYVIQRFYIPTSRQLKRLESTSRSPIYSHFGESVSGTSSIRAYACQDRFARESELKVDSNQMPFYLSIISNRWLAIRLEMLGNLIILLAAVLAVLARETMSPGLVGLSISYALQITATLNFLVRMTSDVETNIVAVERIKEYGEIPEEAPWEQMLTKPPRNWPRDGKIEFQNYQVRYREGMDLVLHDISFSIQGGEKVGLVGRTGAGKSSLALGIFRIIEASGGTILIDGLDISTLGLHDLRSRLNIIPQDPVLFSGSLRMNLDPFGTHADPELWRVLQLAHLRDMVETLPKGLAHELSEGGGNLSVGQRQLVCLARALLRKTRVLVMDEATGAIDLETDDLIQDTIRSEFKDCTILTIAHRLNTIIDSDRVVVLDQGRVVESGAPAALLRDRASTFFGMAKQAGLVQ